MRFEAHPTTTRAAQRLSAHDVSARDEAPRFPPTRVVKIGGSLMSGTACGEPLLRWFARQRPCGTLVIAGGGMLADAVRTLDQRYSLPPRAAHELAIRAMQLNAFVLCQCHGEFSWMDRLASWSAMSPGATTTLGMLDPLSFVRDEPAFGGEPLPIGWHVTSDSIAARLAHVVGAMELVLLKSTLPATAATTWTFADAIEAGFVDPHFATAAKHLRRVRTVNLCDPTFPELYLQAATPRLP